ncbi:MAG: shikimate kinase [Proteobacteria bacterium]|nr:shikimate kinase [Pseudomonadota bacterium]MBW3616861.1 shikimate kinase [Pseudomonadota bacterium]
MEPSRSSAEATPPASPEPEPEVGDGPPPAPQTRSVVLVGLMGAGKTTVGRRLARALGLPFKDADGEIEVAAGRSVSEIFAERGEGEFRAGERRVIQRLLDGAPMVLATGGGAFMNADTRRLIRARAVSIWLRADLDVLAARCGRRNTRPLLQTGDPRQTLERLARERYPIYAEADLTVETSETPHDAAVAAILEALRRFEARTA